MDEVISEVSRRPVMQTRVHHNTKLVLNPLVDIQPAECVCVVLWYNGRT